MTEDTQSMIARYESELAKARARSMYATDEVKIEEIGLYMACLRIQIRDIRRALKTSVGA